MTDAQAYAQPDPLLDGNGDDKPNGLTAETVCLMALCDREYREAADACDRALSDAWTRKVDAEITGSR